MPSILHRQSKQSQSLKKTKEGLILELDTEIDMSIPVSKTYGQQIAALFTKEYETEASTSPPYKKRATQLNHITLIYFSKI